MCSALKNGGFIPYTGLIPYTSDISHFCITAQILLHDLPSPAWLCLFFTVNGLLACHFYLNSYSDLLASFLSSGMCNTVA